MAVMPLLHFIFLLYAIVTLEGLRPSATRSFEHSSYQCHTAGQALEAAAGASPSVGVTHATQTYEPMFFVDTASIIVLPVSWFHHPHGQAVAPAVKRAKGSYFYTFSGLSPPRFS
jgi:hypothetical protein